MLIYTLKRLLYVTPVVIGVSIICFLLVHIAPGHGADDFDLGQANGLPVPDTVGPDGVYLPGVPLFAGRMVYRPDGKPGNADEAVIAAVDAVGGLLARGAGR